MWFSFLRPRDRFSVDNLRYLADQLAKVHIVNEVNKDFVIEAIRSIAELIIYGDQHDDSTFFELFMEKQIMGEFERILKSSRTLAVSLQLLQTMSILMQNLKKEHAIYYMFSNEHMNHLITYSFDFRNHDLLSYYISFLRAISGKLDQNTISLLVKTENEDVVSFPLYVEAIKFAFHEESMVRTAVRNLALNIYIVGDDSVNRYVTSAPHAEYFLNLVTFFRKQCIDLNCLVSEATKNPGQEINSSILAAVNEIEDNLYYFSDVISAGIFDVGRLMTDNLLLLLIFPILFPSLSVQVVNEIQFGAVTSLFLLCCLLHIVKIKDLANVIAAALFLPLNAFLPKAAEKSNGYKSALEFSHESEMDACSLRFDDLELPSSSHTHPVDSGDDCHYSQLSLREALLYYVTNGDDVQVSGSLCVLATLLQTKELDESMLDALGILPQRKQHKKLLLEALVGEGLGEEQLFSPESNSVRDGIGSELDGYLQKLKVKYRVECSVKNVGASPRSNRFEVLDALVNLFCRSNISAETMWEGGWLLRQLLPYSEAEFNSDHLKLLNDSYRKCALALLLEVKGIWADLLIPVLYDEWKKCKRAIEASSPRKELKSILLSSQKFSAEGESSFAAGERMCETVKVFVLLHQLQTFSLGRILPDQPVLSCTDNACENIRAKTAGIDASSLKPGTELRLVDAVPCRIAFERGKERHFYFLPVSLGTTGWVILAEELPLKQNYGIVRVAAPLPGSNPRVETKHPRWLNLRIRPSTLPFVDPAKSGSYPKPKMKTLVDGRWTLAFRDEESCKSAFSMILEEIDLLSNEVERRIKPYLPLKV